MIIWGFESMNTISASFQPLTADSPELEKQRARKLCNEFEAIFISKLLQSMRPSQESGLFGDGLGADVYQSLFETKVAEKIAATGGIGISDIVYKSLFAGETGAVETPQFHGFSGTIAQRGVLWNESFLDRIQRYESIIRSAAERYRLPVGLIKAVIKTESYGDAFVVSKAGAKGLMQLMDETASALGVRNSFDPKENILGGSRYLREQIDRFGGDLKLALAAYNAGPGNVEKYNGIPPFKETQNYVVQVLRSARELNADLENI